MAKHRAPGDVPQSRGGTTAPPRRPSRDSPWAEPRPVHRPAAAAPGVVGVARVAPTSRLTPPSGAGPGWPAAPRPPAGPRRPAGTPAAGRHRRATDPVD
ncbi:hypothetical protein GA0070616_1378 [Micromonospora nigra]|uniref:Uncharacterized protein n=1 Tax=Micromonospora nigra TaxID=145857 RepID=A0A1C6RLF7_9ACTN|nr:hypothetical protein [Micromonospora nigra]SCL17876.1 hypothetical protein GA0070616_1378 [Micromonospora nigra]